MGKAGVSGLEKSRASAFGPAGWLNRSLWVVGYLAFVIHGWILSAHLVDLPYADEWTDFATARAFSPQLNFTWLFSTLQNHPRVLHCFLKWVDYYVTGGNYASFALFSFLCFAVGTAFLLRVLEKRFHIGLGIAFLLLASDRNYENHSWADQSFFFHYIFFTYLAFFGCFQAGRRSWWGVPAILVAAFSTLGGLSSALVYVGATVGVALAHALKVPLVRKLEGGGTKPIYRRLTQAALVVAAIASWKIFGTFDNENPPLTPPWSLNFIERFLNTFSSGFGHEKFHDLQGIVLGAVFIAALYAVGKSLVRQNDPKKWASWLSVLCIAGALTLACAMTAIGRGYQPMWTSKLSRYAAFTLFVVPIWWLFVREALDSVPARARWVAGALAFCLLVLPFGNNYRFRRIYATISTERYAQLETLRAYVAGQVPSVELPGLPAHKAAARLERTRQLGMSFWRQLKVPAAQAKTESLGR